MFYFLECLMIWHSCKLVCHIEIMWTQRLLHNNQLNNFYQIERWRGEI